MSNNINLQYLFEDAQNLAEYAHSKEFSDEYDVDPNQIYLLGHSMGANSALNAGKNLIVFCGTYDSVSPLNEMILPLWQKLESHTTSAVQKKIELPTEHGLLGRRITVIKEIANFIEETL